MATTKQGKIKEIKKLLGKLPLKILTLKDITLPKNFCVAEDGKTFKENAVKKAKAYGNFSKILTLADDSGLCVDALSGKPGVKSARYHRGNDQARIKKLLFNLKNIPLKKRTARFVCVAALYNPQNGRMKTERGECAGLILNSSQGRKGFGYDPVFYLPCLKKTFAQISIAQKNKYSHRALAIKKLKPSLKSRGKNV